MLAATAWAEIEGDATSFERRLTSCHLALSQMNKTYASWVPQMAPLPTDLIILWLCQLDTENLTSVRECHVSSLQHPREGFKMFYQSCLQGSYAAPWSLFTENSLIFIYYDLALFPVVKEALTSGKKKHKLRQTRNILTGNGLSCTNVTAANSLGVLTVCQWESEGLPTSTMFRCPVWKSEKTLQKGKVNLSGKCSFTPGSQEGNSWGKVTVCRPDSQRQKFEYKVNSQERKEM